MSDSASHQLLDGTKIPFGWRLERRGRSYAAIMPPCSGSDTTTLIVLKDTYSEAKAELKKRATILSAA